jgi:hypothetical protein
VSSSILAAWLNSSLALAGLMSRQFAPNMRAPSNATTQLLGAWSTQVPLISSESEPDSASP